jgi:hypothetical protein
MESQKIFPLLIIFVLVASTTLTVYPVAAVSNPSPPEFTVQYVDHSYDVPPTYGTDPYTGQTIKTGGGYHVDNRTIDVTITNQPFTPYKDPTSNQTVNLFYNIRSKGHFEDWTNANSDHNQGGLKPFTSAYTVISFNIEYWNVPQGGQIDFQVQAILSYTANTYSGSCFTGSQTTPVAQSDWSSTQTITIGNPTPSSPTPPSISTPNPTFNPYLPTATPTPPQNPTATPTQPNILTGALSSLDWMQTTLIALVVAVVVLALVVVALLRIRTTK